MGPWFVISASINNLCRTDLHKLVFYMTNAGINLCMTPIKFVLLWPPQEQSISEHPVLLQSADGWCWRGHTQPATSCRRRGGRKARRRRHDTILRQHAFWYSQSEPSVWVGHAAADDKRRTDVNRGVFWRWFTWWFRWGTDTTSWWLSYIKWSKSADIDVRAFCAGDCFSSLKFETDLKHAKISGHYYIITWHPDSWKIFKAPKMYRYTLVPFETIVFVCMLKISICDLIYLANLSSEDEFQTGSRNLRPLGPISRQISSPLTILSMENAIVAKVPWKWLVKLKSVSRLKIFRKTGPRDLFP